MRTRLILSLSFAIAAAFLLISAPNAQAQCGTNTIGFGNVGTIPNNPFHAEIVITSNSPAHRTSTAVHYDPQHVARDAQGRVRTDATAGEFQYDTGAEEGTKAEEHLIRICDTTAQTLTQIGTLNASAKIIHSRPSAPRASKNPPRTFCASRLPSNRAGHQQIEDLGSRNIEGVEAHGVRIQRPTLAPISGDDTSTGENFTEIWCSDDLAAIVLTVSENTKSGTKNSVAMRNIERSEPDPTLFQIPQGYTVTESVEEPRTSSGEPK